MEVLYRFEFDKGEIFEVKYIDLPKTAPKSKRFKWFIVIENVKTELSFLSMSVNTREFMLNGKPLFLDMYNKYIDIDGKRCYFSK